MATNDRNERYLDHLQRPARKEPLDEARSQPSSFPIPESISNN